LVRLVVCAFIALLLTGCGVDTDSSSRSVTEDTNSTDNNQTVDPDDGNATDPTEDPEEDLGEPNEDQPRSDFDTRDAIEDPDACRINGTFKNAMEDSSFDPTGTVDELNGINIASSYRYNADIAKTVIVIYYPDLANQNAKTGTQVNLREDNYRISYDMSWGGNEIKNIYIRTPRDVDSKYYGCVRYTLAASAGAVVKQRVYRVND